MTDSGAWALCGGVGENERPPSSRLAWVVQIPGLRTGGPLALCAVESATCALSPVTTNSVLYVIVDAATAEPLLLGAVTPAP